jgi:hypothetical protein
MQTAAVWTHADSDSPSASGGRKYAASTSLAVLRRWRIEQSLDRSHSRPVVADARHLIPLEKHIHMVRPSKSHSLPKTVRHPGQSSWEACTLHS